MFRAYRRLQQFGRIHTVNSILDENYVLKSSKPPIHHPKVSFEDVRQTRGVIPPERSVFEVVEAPLPKYIDDGDGDLYKSIDVLDGLDSSTSLRQQSSSMLLRGLHPEGWLTPFEVVPISFSYTRIKVGGMGDVSGLISKVMVGNLCGAAGFGSCVNFKDSRDRVGTLRVAIQNALKNLVVIDPSPPELLHPIKTNWRHVRIYMYPFSRGIQAIPLLRKACRLIGIKKVNVFVDTIDDEAMVKAFFYALGKYHRSAEEIASARGLALTGNRHVEPYRVFKGMYTMSPPVEDRQTVADRWKWQLKRSTVMQYPNSQVMQEVLYKDVSLASELAAANVRANGNATRTTTATVKWGDVVTAAEQSTEAKKLQTEVQKANSGENVNQYWEQNEEKFRMETEKWVLREKDFKRRRQAMLARKFPDLSPPEMSEEEVEKIQQSAKEEWEMYRKYQRGGGGSTSGATTSSPSTSSSSPRKPPPMEE